jgi:DNA-binding protein HU-beta
MNKEQLIASLAEKTGSSKSDAERFLNAYTETITEELASNDNARIQQVGFGSFEVRVRPATTGRNPRTGEPIQIPEKSIVRFVPGKRLKDAVNA